MLEMWAEENVQYGKNHLAREHVLCFSFLVFFFQFLGYNSFSKVRFSFFRKGVYMRIQTIIVGQAGTLKRYSHSMQRQYQGEMRT